MWAGVKANKAFIEQQTRLIRGESGSGTAQNSDEQQPAAIKIEVSIGAHMVFPLSLGIGRENRWEFMCLQTWKGLLSHKPRLIWGEPGSRNAQISDEQSPAEMTDDVTIGAHGVWSLSLGIGRENWWEFMCLHTLKKFMEP